MSELQVHFQPFDLRNATENEYACLSEFKNILNREYLPDDPPIPVEEQMQGWKKLPHYIEYDAYAGWDSANSRVIAYAQCMIFHTGDNEHVANLRIEVVPEHRHKGISRQSLKLLLPFIQKHKRTLLISFTSDRIPETTVWFERLGGRKGLQMQVNQLQLAEFDKSLVQKWLAESQKNRSDFELAFFAGIYPDEIIDEIAALYQEVANDQPRDNLEIEDMNFTVEILRQDEQNLFARGDHRWTMYLMDPTKRKVVGLTEVFWNPNRDMILNQGFTGVFPEYRNKGLGRWLKAEMMQKILTERPEVKFIRTGNANSNAPMLKINSEMGFKPYISNTIWQVDTVQVENFLRSK